MQIKVRNFIIELPDIMKNRKQEARLMGILRLLKLNVCIKVDKNISL